jgi:GntR family transcriptional regulator
MPIQRQTTAHKATSLKGAKSPPAIQLGGPSPLYHQIYALLRDEILSGALPYGASVPTEHELISAYGVSRITARRALDELAERRMVVRRRRVGTVVSFQAPQKPFQADIRQAVDALTDFGRATEVRLLEIGEVPARGWAAAAFGLEADAPVSRTVRVRWLDGEPLGRTVSFVPVEIGRKLTLQELEETPMLALLQRLGYVIGKASQFVSAAAADAELAADLHIDVQSPVLAINRTVFGADGEALLLTRAVYRSDRYNLVLDLHPHEV